MKKRGGNTSWFTETGGTETYLANIDTHLGTVVDEGKDRKRTDQSGQATMERSAFLDQ